MNFWNELTKSALLGSAKQTAPLDILPTPIRERLAGADPNDREDFFFRAAALSWVWQMAGTLPEKISLPLPELAPEQQAQICPESYWPLLRKCLEEPQRLGLFFELILQKMAEKQYVLPHSLLVSTLNYALESNKNTAPKLLEKVLGERGQWIAALNPKWHAFLPSKSSEFDFSTATAAERKAWLLQHRTLQPELVFDYIQSAWLEEGVRERKEWLKILSIQTRLEELPFLEQELEQLSHSKDKNKPLNLEIRREIYSILLQKPGSRLFNQVAEKLACYVSNSSSMLGLVKKQQIDIPAQGDDFLCKEVMVDEFAFEHISPKRGWTDSEFWFGQLIEMIHPSVWEGIFKADWSKIFPHFYALHQDRKEPAHYMMQQLRDSIQSSLHSPAILTISEQKGLESLMVPEMLQALRPSELEHYLMNNAKRFAPDISNLKRYGQEWDFSHAFSRFVLEYLSKQQMTHFDGRYLQKIALMMHPSILTDIPIWEAQAYPDYYAQAFQRQFLQPLTQLMHIRLDIKNW